MTETELIASVVRHGYKHHNATVAVQRLRPYVDSDGAGSVRLRNTGSRKAGRYRGELENRIFREIRWVTRQELLQLDFLEADLQLVKDLAGGKNRLTFSHPLRATRCLG